MTARQILLEGLVQKGVGLGIPTTYHLLNFLSYQETSSLINIVQKLSC
jgi:hypothetical protein